MLTRSCLAPEAIDRPKDAQAVADGLTAYLGGVQEKLRRVELAEAAARAKAVEETKRRRVILALAATVLRRLGTLRHVLAAFLEHGIPAGAPRVETALLIGAAQILWRY